MRGAISVGNGQPAERDVDGRRNAADVKDPHGGVAADGQQIRPWPLDRQTLVNCQFTRQRDWTGKGCQVEVNRVASIGRGNRLAQRAGRAGTDTARIRIAFDRDGGHWRQQDSAFRGGRLVGMPEREADRQTKSQERCDQVSFHFGILRVQVLVGAQDIRRPQQSG